MKKQLQKKEIILSLEKKDMMLVEKMIKVIPFERLSLGNIFIV